jgi:zinc protease
MGTLHSFPSICGSLRKPLIASMAAVVCTCPALASDPSIRFTQAVLTNGLRLVVSEDHAAPVVSVAVVYNVGLRNERPGQSGLAHLFEHLTSAGSANVAPGEHGRLINFVGGRSNANAQPGFTTFFATVPANQLELVLFLEADRMRSLKITNERLEIERKVVAEERRLRIENQPWGRTFEVVYEQAFRGFSHVHPGNDAEDVARTTLEDARRFYAEYYGPNNAVLAVVGDVDAARTDRLVRKYFADIPARPRPPEPDTTGPPIEIERRQVLSDSLATISRIDMAWHVPPSNADSAALDLLASALGDGRASRLYKALNNQRALALRDITAVSGEGRDPGLFSVFLTFPTSSSPAEVETATIGEIERLRLEGVTEGELQRAKKQMLLFLVQQSMTGSLARARSLAESAITTGDPGEVNHRIQLDRCRDRGRRPTCRTAVLGPHKTECRGHLPKERRPVVHA